MGPGVLQGGQGPTPGSASGPLPEREQRSGPLEGDGGGGHPGTEPAQQGFAAIQCGTDTNQPILGDEILLELSICPVEEGPEAEGHVALRSGEGLVGRGRLRGQKLLQTEKAGSDIENGGRTAVVQLRLLYQLRAFLKQPHRLFILGGIGQGIEQVIDGRQSILPAVLVGTGEQIGLLGVELHPAQVGRGLSVGEVVAGTVGMQPEAQPLVLILPRRKCSQQRFSLAQMVRYPGGLQPVQQDVHNKKVGVTEDGAGKVDLRLAEQNPALFHGGSGIAHQVTQVHQFSAGHHKEGGVLAKVIQPDFHTPAQQVPGLFLTAFLQLQQGAHNEQQIRHADSVKLSQRVQTIFQNIPVEGEHLFPGLPLVVIDNLVEQEQLGRIGALAVDVPQGQIDPPRQGIRLLEREAVRLRPQEKGQLHQRDGTEGEEGLVPGLRIPGKQAQQHAGVGRRLVQAADRFGQQVQQPLPLLRAVLQGQQVKLEKQGGMLLAPGRGGVPPVGQTGRGAVRGRQGHRSRPPRCKISLSIPRRFAASPEWRQVCRLPAGALPWG